MEEHKTKKHYVRKVVNKTSDLGRKIPKVIVDEVNGNGRANAKEIGDKAISEGRKEKKKKEKKSKSGNHGNVEEVLELIVCDSKDCKKKNLRLNGENWNHWETSEVTIGSMDEANWSIRGFDGVKDDRRMNRAKVKMTLTVNGNRSDKKEVDAPMNFRKCPCLVADGKKIVNLVCIWCKWLTYSSLCESLTEALAIT